MNDGNGPDRRCSALAEAGEKHDMDLLIWILLPWELTQEYTTKQKSQA